MSARLNNMSTGRKVLLGAVLYGVILIALGIFLGSEGKNDAFKPQNEFKLDPWITIQIGGIDLSINKASSTWCSRPA